jgi:hypothetical protein
MPRAPADIVRDTKGRRLLLWSAGAGSPIAEAVCSVGVMPSPNCSLCRLAMPLGSRQCLTRCSAPPRPKPCKPLSISIWRRSPASSHRAGMVVTDRTAGFAVAPRPSMMLDAHDGLKGCAARTGYTGCGP